jgi:hypothetical protein
MVIGLCVPCTRASAHAHDADRSRKTAVSPDGAVVPYDQDDDDEDDVLHRGGDSVVDQSGGYAGREAIGPFDGSTGKWPTDEEMARDIWTAPEVPWSARTPAIRVFEVLPAGEHYVRWPAGHERSGLTKRGSYKAQNVVVVDHADAAAWAPTHIPCDSADGPKWNGLAAEQGEAVTTEQCWYKRQDEMHAAAQDFVSRFASVLTEEFGVAKELPCKLARGLYATKVRRGFEADSVWHHDICRAEPNILITALSYPHDNGWKTKWRGHTEFARVDCSVEPPPRTNRTPPALRVAPMPNRTVVFSGRIYHTTSSAKASKRSRRSDPKASRNRYSVVLRLQCCRGRYTLSKQRLTCK